MQEITAICRAKINLTLEVLARRPDGYHNIRSVMQSVDLADTIRIIRGPDDGITVIFDSPDVPSGENNTVSAACKLFLEASALDAGLTVTVHKHIPMQAGMGGGSSDAAGTLLALNALFDERLGPAELTDLAGRIGSDVPFFLVGGTAVVEGKGEKVEKLSDAPRMDLVIVKPDFGVSTAWAYSRLARVGDRRPSAATEAVVDAVRRGDRTGIVRNLHNDFEPVVIVDFPEIAEIKRRLAELGAEGALMSGSGAAVFGVFPGAEEAKRASESLRVTYPMAVAVCTAARAVEIGECTDEG